jgi:AraC-like DNA-binding protein
MLVETDLSISEIAMALGYNNVAHIARMFKQQMGMSTLSFRRKYKSINL